MYCIQFLYYTLTDNDNLFYFHWFLVIANQTQGDMSECLMFEYHISRQEHPAGEEVDPGQGDLRPRLPVLHTRVGPEAGPALHPHLSHRGHQHQQCVHSEDAQLQVSDCLHSPEHMMMMMLGVSCSPPAPCSWSPGCHTSPALSSPLANFCTVSRKSVLSARPVLRALCGALLLLTWPHIVRVQSGAPDLRSPLQSSDTSRPEQRRPGDTNWNTHSPTLSDLLLMLSGNN